MRGTALCCALLLCGGCSLVFSTSDLAGDAPDGGTPDAPADGPPVVVGEGGADTGPSNEAGGSFCKSLSPEPKHCADFDDGNLLGFFSDIGRDPKDSTTTVVAESGGVRAAINGAGGCSYARLTKTVPSSGQGMRIRFKMKATAPWTNDQIFFFLNLEDGLNDCGFLFHLGEGGTSAWLHPQWGDPEQNDGNDLSEHPKVGEWSQVAIEFAATSTPTISITIDGRPAITSQSYGQCAFGTAVYVAMGFHCSSGTAEVRYDDLVIDYP